MNIRKVTVGVDGSPTSLTVLDWVIDRAKTAPTRLQIVTVITAIELEWDLGTVRTYYEQTLKEAEDRARSAAPFEAISTSTRTGSVTHELLEASTDSDLLVVGTDKTSLVRHLVYGTVPLRLAALSATPLVVVPKTWQPNSGSVLLAVGDGKPSETAMAFAEEEAVRADAPLELVHVWAAPPAYPSPLYLIDYPWESIKRSGQAVLDSTAEAIRRRHPALPVREVLVEGPTIPRLVEASAGAGLLVVGRDERGVLHDLVQLGSVAHDVLLNPASPIAVIPAQQVAAAVPEPAHLRVATR